MNSSISDDWLQMTVVAQLVGVPGTGGMGHNETSINQLLSAPHKYMDVCCFFCLGTIELLS